jgi:hypothetical protein
MQLVFPSLGSTSNDTFYSNFNDIKQLKNYGLEPI